MLPSLIDTLLAVIFTLLIAVPLGVMAAIFLVEYTTRGNAFVKVVRVTAETLAGIPSIVYGLFGLLFFVTFCHWGLSIMSGCLTLAIMVLPTIMRTTEEALLAVPDSYREGKLWLGRRPFAHGAFGCAAAGYAGHFGRHHLVYRPHCG